MLPFSVQHQTLRCPKNTPGPSPGWGLLPGLKGTKQGLGSVEVAGEPWGPRELLCLPKAACLPLMQQAGSGYVRAAAGAALGAAWTGPAGAAHYGPHLLPPHHWGLLLCSCPCHVVPFHHSCSQTPFPFWSIPSSIIHTISYNGSFFLPLPLFLSYNPPPSLAVLPGVDPHPPLGQSRVSTSVFSDEGTLLGAGVRGWGVEREISGEKGMEKAREEDLGKGPGRWGRWRQGWEGEEV